MEVSAGKCCEGEKWLPVPDTDEMYYISSCGRVWSVPRTVECGPGRWKKGNLVRQLPGKLLKPHKRRGYLEVTLNTKNGRKYLLIHTTVAKLFLGEPTEGCKCVIHVDKCIYNNHALNLKWVPYQVTMQRAYKKKDINKLNIKRGSEHPKAKLRESDVHTIKLLRDQGLPMSEIAEAYGVGCSTIKNIIYGKCWTHVT